MRGGGACLPHAISAKTLRYKLIICAFIIACYGPILTGSFFFHDDFLNFSGISGGANFFAYTISQGREVTGLLTDLMGYVTVNTSWHLRIFSVAGVCLYALIVLQCLLETGCKPFRAILTSMALSVITPIVNVAAYGSMFCYSFALAFSSMSVIYFRKGIIETDWPNKKGSKYLYFIVGCLYVVISNFIYQATAAIAFSIILLLYLNDKNSKKNEPFQLATLFIVATGVYYLLVKAISQLTGVNVMGRGGIVSSFNEAVQKLVWFKWVLQENIKQVASSFVGYKQFTSIWMHYILVFKNSIFGIVVCSIMLLLLMGGFVLLLREKGVIGGIQCIVIIPLSYYVFLVLSENSYTSYYSVALSSTLLIIMIHGVGYISEHFCDKKRFVSIFCSIEALVIFVMAFNASLYQTKFWVEYNTYQYNGLKCQIAESFADQNRIHVIGSLYPGQADVYVTKAATIALDELNINRADTEITASDNEMVVNQLALENYEKVLQGLNLGDRKILESSYDINYDFSLCSLKTGLGKEQINALHDIFVNAGILIDGTQENELLIDITNNTENFLRYWK